MNRQQRDELRDKVAKKNLLAVILDTAAPQPSSPSKIEPLAAIKPADQLRYTCGHRVGDLGACPSCQAAARKAKKAMSSKAQKAKRFWGEDKPRLPAGSRFDVTYDGATKTWSGALTIPMNPREDIVIVGQAGGVFRLLEQLDVKYRGKPPERGTCTAPTRPVG